MTPAVRLTPEPLNDVAFAGFGEVVQHGGGRQRRYFSAPFEHAPQADRMEFWVSRFTRPATLPLQLRQLERHACSAQTFVPLSLVRFLVVVALPGPDGLPDPAGVRAFVAGPGQGVSYRMGVWHCGLTILDAPAEFAVMMAMTGGTDDEFCDLPEPIEILALDGAGTEQ